ncbi:hypothetical protein [Francisella tularensis]|uniref:hypothetical protein n=1 Tax=Francisella tularensis TaxID=263 RepID=UPI001C0F016B|nr:hypothetical protein [Francisella tularensis]MBK2108962.1 hypothetical protein [Francisella tularensis subsp. novicida FSC595]
MEQQGKYYNPKYPETSNEWTKKWDKSWLLRKDIFFLKYASEEMRKNVYKNRLYKLILSLFVFYTVSYYFLNDYLNIVTIIISLMIFVRYNNILYLVLNFFLCFVVPYGLISNVVFSGSESDFLIGVLLSLILLTYGIFYMIYFVSLLSLKKIDIQFFDKVYKLFINENFKSELKDSIKKVYLKKKILKFLFEKFMFKSNLDIISLDSVILSCDKKYSIWVSEVIRLSYLYHCIYLVKGNEFFEGNVLIFPKIRLCYVFIISLLTQVLLVSLSAGFILGIFYNIFFK